MNRDDVIKASLEYFNGDELAAGVFADKYCLFDPKTGEYHESSPDQMHWRMANEFARIESKYSNSLDAATIYNAFKDFAKIVPQGSPMAGIGNTFQIVSLSNCYVIDSPLDSYASILKTDQEQAQLMKRRGGVGFDISNIRPKGMPTNNAAKTTDGISVFMERFSNTTREVAQNGRRGALMLTISVHHPEVETFINIKRDRKKVTGANISVRLSDEFMEAVQNDTEYEQYWPLTGPRQIIKKVKAKDIWDQIVQGAWDNAEPGILFWDNIKKRTPADCYQEFETTSTNPCFVPGTLVHTKDGHYPIESLVGKSVSIWNGKSWVSIDNFRVTGENQKVLTIRLNDGSEEIVTPYHTCILEDGSRIEAKDLRPGMSLKITEAPTTHGNHFEPGAYIKGFLIGDGTCDADKPILQLYEPKYSCMGRLIESANEVSTRDSRSDAIIKPDFVENNQHMVMRGISVRPDLLNWCKDYKTELPVEIFSWDKQSKLNFIAGVMDADGTASDTKNGWAYQISSIHKSWLKQFQTLLKTVGVYSKLGLMKKATKKFMPDGKGGQKEYDCQDCWRLTVGQESSIKLAQQVKFARLTDFSHKKTAYKIQPRWNKVVEIVDAGVAEKVYCCTVDETHQLALSSGNDWGQCGEICLSPNDSCRLMLLNTLGFVKKPYTPNASFDWMEFSKHARMAQRLMDDMIDLELECIDKILAKIDADPEPEDVKYYERALWEKIRWTCENGRRTGLGVTAIGDTLAALGLQYGSDQSIKMVEDIYRELTVSSYYESIILAEERGAFSVWSYEAEKDHSFIKQILDCLPLDIKKKYKKTGRRNIANTTTAPAGSVSILTQTTSGIEPAYLLGYERYRKINPTDSASKVDRVDVVGDKWTKYTVYHHGFQKWMSISGKTDVKESPYYKATAPEIDWTARIKLQAAAQKWICHAISSTINLPKDVAVDTVKNLYMEAWEAGCKGVTVYREGSRDGVLVSESKQKETDLQYHSAPKRPEELQCEVHRVNIKGEPWTVFLGLFNGKPYEIMGGKSQFIDLPKKIKSGIIRKIKKKDEAAYDFVHGDGEDQIVIKDLAKTFENPTHGSFTRTISLALRHGTPIQYVVEQLQKGDKESDMFTFSKVMARVLKDKIKDGTKVNKTCHDCGSDNLAYQQGCVTCLNCGNSKCG